MFWNNAKQQRIDELAFEVSSLEESLAAERGRSREKGRLASELLAERDAARIERDTAQASRDQYAARLAVFEERQNKAKMNLRQFRKPDQVQAAQL